MANYTCKPGVGCYSYQSPETGALFIELQRYLNRYAKSLQFKLLQVDGIIGPSSRAAAEKIAMTIPQTGVSSDLVRLATQMQPFTREYEILTQNAGSFLTFLQRGAAEIGLPAVADPPKTTPAPPPTNPSNDLIVSATGPISTAGPARKYLLVGLGGLLAAGLLVGGYKLATRNKGEKSKEMGFPTMMKGPPPWKGDWKKIPGTHDYQTSDGRVARYAGSYGRANSYRVYAGKKQLSTGGIVGMDGRHIGMN